MGKLMIPDYRDDIEETILPDSDSEKEAQEADVKPAVADTSENRNEENNEEKDKGKTVYRLLPTESLIFWLWQGSISAIS